MLQKIENLFVRIYNYIKYHLREVVIVFLVLAVLFLLGDKLGWNDLIRNFITDLFVYLSTRNKHQKNYSSKFSFSYRKYNFSYFCGYNIN